MNESLIERLSNRELLEAIWNLEAKFKTRIDRTHDHRLHLSREELEVVYRLISRRLNLMAEPPVARAVVRH